MIMTREHRIVPLVRRVLLSALLILAGCAETASRRMSDPERDLPQKSVDLFFTCNTCHHLPDRAAYFLALLPVLRPAGRVAVIDYKGEGLIEGLVGHWTAEETVRHEMEAAGYRLVEEFDYLLKQHFQTFSPTQP